MFLSAVTCVFKSLYMCCLCAIKNRYGLGRIEQALFPPLIWTLLGLENMRTAGECHHPKSAVKIQKILGICKFWDTKS